MVRRALIAALSLGLSLGLLAGPALASEEAPKKEVGQYVDIQPVGMPIVVKGVLVNYVFVYVRLNLAGNADVSRWRQKEPLFRDALVRAGHRTPFVLANDYTKIDAAKLSATLMREVAPIAGPGVIRSIVVTSQASRGRAPPPRA